MVLDKYIYRIPKTEFKYKKYINENVYKSYEKHGILTNRATYTDLKWSKEGKQDLWPLDNIKPRQPGSRSFPHSWFITGIVTRLTRRVPLVDQELLTLPEHLSSVPVFSGVRVTRSLILCMCFIDRCLSFCTFSFGNCAVCSCSIYGFWLPLWYL